MQDLPGDTLPADLKPQTLGEMEGWCRNAAQDSPVMDPVELTTGDVIVHDSS
jgi:hypothetical protein